MDNFTFVRNDTALIRLQSGAFQRQIANAPQATNDIDSIGTYFKGAWIPKTLTNVFRDSEPAVDPGQGTRTNVTFSACDWALGFNTALDGMVTFGDNSVTREYYNTANLVATTAYSLACIIKTDDGNTPTFGTTSADIGRFLLTGSSITSGYTIIELGVGYYFVTASGTSGGASLGNNGMFKNSANNAIGFEVSAIMCVLGTVDLTIFDYIRTTGASLARQLTDIRKTDFPELSDVGFVVDVDFKADSTTGRLLKYGNADNTDLRLSKVSDNTISFAYWATSQQWAIATSAITTGRYRIGMLASNGFNCLYIDGVKIEENTGVFSGVGFVNLVLGRNISGTSNLFTDGGFLNLEVIAQPTEAQIQAKTAYANLTDLINFQRLTVENLADVNATILALQGETV